MSHPQQTSPPPPAKQHSKPSAQVAGDPADIHTISQAVSSLSADIKTLAQKTPEPKPQTPDSRQQLVTIFLGLLAATATFMFIAHNRHHCLSDLHRALLKELQSLNSEDSNTGVESLSKENLELQTKILRERYDAALATFLLLAEQAGILVVGAITYSVAASFHGDKFLPWILTGFYVLSLPFAVCAFHQLIWGDLARAHTTQHLAARLAGTKTDLKLSPLPRFSWLIPSMPSDDRTKLKEMDVKYEDHNKAKEGAEQHQKPDKMGVVEMYLKEGEIKNLLSGGYVGPEGGGDELRQVADVRGSDHEVRQGDS